MRPILAYLRGLGVVPTPSITLPEGPVEVVLERYRQHLKIDRGLAPTTACGYIYAVRPFLGGRILPNGHDLNLEHLGHGRYHRLYRAIKERALARTTPVGLKTRSWPFSRRFDYADSTAAIATCNRGWRRKVGIMNRILSVMLSHER